MTKPSTRTRKPADKAATKTAEPTKRAKKAAAGDAIMAEIPAAAKKAEAGKELTAEESAELEAACQMLRDCPGAVRRCLRMARYHDLSLADWLRETLIEDAETFGDAAGCLYMEMRAAFAWKED